MTQQTIANSNNIRPTLLALATSLAIHAAIFFQLDLAPTLVRLGDDVPHKSVQIRVLQAKQVTAPAVSKPKAPTKKDLAKKLTPRPETVSEAPEQKIESIPGQQTILARYLEDVRLAVESQKFYPPSAKRMRQEGVVEATFTLNRSGALLKLISISGQFAALNDAVKELISSKVQFPTMPSELNQEDIKITLPISFELI